MKLKWIQYSVIITFCMIVFSNMSSQAPLWKWGRGVESGPGYLSGFGVSADHNGNSYVVGYTEPSCDPDFGNGFVLSGAVSPFIVKYDSLGNTMWAQSVEGVETGGSEIYWSVEVDAAGNIIAAGTSNSPTISAGSATLSIGGIQAANLEDPNRRRIFMTKYDGNGNVLWLKQLEHAPWNPIGLEEYGFRTACDAQNNIYLTGYLSTSDPDYYWIFGNDTLHSSGAFTAKFDSEGQGLWVQPFGGMGLSVDPSGNIFTCGDMYLNNNSDAIIGNDTLAAWPNYDSSWYSVSYITKINNNGSLQWSRSCGKIQSQNIFYNGFNRGLTSDINGNVLLACDWTDSLFIGTDTLIGVTGPNTYYSIFVTKFNGEGNYLWAKSDTTNLHFGTISTMGTDGEGNIYLGGLTSNAMLSKLDPDGNFLWAKNNPFAYCRTIDVSASGNVYATGIAIDGIPCDFDVDIVNSSAGPIYREGYFAARLGTSFTVGTEDLTLFNQVQIFPNPAKDQLYINSNTNIVGQQYIIYNSSGQRLISGIINSEKTLIPLQKLSAGFYCLEISGRSNGRFKFVVE